MGTIRYFSGGRDDAKRSFANELMRIEITKKGKMDAAERYKMILKKKFEENKLKAMTGPLKEGFSLKGTLKGNRGMSKRAENALKEVAAKKAAKQAKALRKMVIIEPRTYSVGRLTKKGKIYDVAGNMVATVNKKNGKMATMGGWALGKYKPKSYMTQLVIQDAITKYSPHYINLRKMQAMQQGATYEPPANNNNASMTRAQDVINLYGSTAAPQETFDPATFYGSSAGGPRQNIGITAWGAMSDNAWGTFTDNAWGTSTDTVWGTNQSDVWGGIGGSPFGGGKSVQVFGTGNGKNYLRKLTNFIAAFLGLKTKASRQAFRDGVKNVRSRNRSTTRGTTTRGGGAPVRSSAPTTRR